MNIILLGALALASTPSTQPAPSTDGAWLDLDRQLESLAGSLAPEGGGAEVSAWIKTAYRNSGDIQFGGNDESGVSISNARLVFSGKVGDYELKASIEGASNGQVGDVTVKDFYARWNPCSAVSAQIGNFKSPFLYTGVESDERLIFFERSSQGRLWAGREAGAMLFGTHGKFQWWAAAQNGGDAQGNDLLLVAKGAFALLGDPLPMKQSGGFGVDAPTRLQAAFGYLDDASAATGSATAMTAELIGVSGPIFAMLEYVDYDDGFVAGSVPTGNAKAAANADVADTSPWGVTAGYMFTEKDEAALRYEDLDDVDNTTLIWAGYNRYLQGHPLKWQFNYVSLSSDAGDVDEFLIGLTATILSLIHI